MSGPLLRQGPLASQLSEATLVDAVLGDHRHLLALFDHFLAAAEGGATHVMELVAGALAVDLRMHSQVGYWLANSLVFKALPLWTAPAC
jgi:hypothetical protein